MESVLITRNEGSIIVTIKWFWVRVSILLQHVMV